MADDLSTSQQIMQQISDIMSGLNDTVSNIGTTLSVIQDKVGQSTAGFDQLTASASKSEKSIGLVSNSLVKFTDQLQGAFNKIKGLSEANTGSIDDLSKSLVDIGSVGLSKILPISSAFSNLGDSAKGSGNIIDDKYKSMLGSITKVGEAVLRHAEANKKAELGLVALYARSGDLNETFKKTSSGIESLRDLTNQFANQMLEVSNATGTTTGETSNYAKMLLTIPGAYGHIIENSPVGSINTLQAAMTVARGTTQDFTDVFSVMDQQFKNFAQVGEKPLELMSRMYSVSQSLGMPFNYINEQIKKTSDQFRFFGDNTSAALKLLSGFAPALKESGVGPAGIQEIVGHLTGAVDSLNIAQKSFISTQTGGAGGLQGGYQMDLLMKQGKMDEVFGKMEEALKKQFGKIVSLEDAAKSPEAAGQLTKQVAFLRQGPMGDVAKSDQEAYKILDAFKAGAKPKIESPTENKNAFATVLDHGTALQERHNNILTKASNELDRFGSSVGDIDAKLVRQVAGTGGEQRGGPMNELVVKSMSEAKTNAAQEQPNTTGGEAAALQSLGRAATMFGDVSNVGVQSVKDLIQNAADKKDNKTQNTNVGKPEDNSKNKNAPTILPTYTKPVDDNKPQLTLTKSINDTRTEITPVNQLHKMLNQSNPDNAARAHRENLVNADKDKTVNASYKESKAGKDDKLTIMLKTDGVKEAQVLAIVHGEIKKFEAGEQHKAMAGFTGGN